MRSWMKWFLGGSIIAGVALNAVSDRIRLPARNPEEGEAKVAAPAAVEPLETQPEPANSEQEEAPSEPLPDIWISIEATPDGRSVATVGKTNLPDGYVLSIWACRYHEAPDAPRCLEAKDGRRFQGESKKVTVVDGSFSAEFENLPSVEEVQAELKKFLDRDQEIAELSGIPIDESMLGFMPDLSVDPQVSISVSGTSAGQSPEILEIIGEKGKNLKGLVVEDGLLDSKRISYKVKVDM